MNIYIYTIYVYIHTPVYNKKEGYHILSYSVVIQVHRFSFVGTDPIGINILRNASECNLVSELNMNHGSLSKYHKHTQGTTLCGSA